MTDGAKVVPTDVGLASIQVADAARYLAMASGKEEVLQHWLDYGVDRLRDTCANLGYDMVLRKTPQQCCDDATARRVAEQAKIDGDTPPVTRMVPRYDTDHRPLMVATDDRPADGLCTDALGHVVGPR